MAFDSDDPVLDACLDEVLAGRTPPDLTARILQAWAARPQAEQSAADKPPPLVFPLAPQEAIPAAPPSPLLAGLPHVFEGASTHPLVDRRSAASGRARRQKSPSTALTIGLAAGVIGL